jgi:hypothetical protein
MSRVYEFLATSVGELTTIRGYCAKVDTEIIELELVYLTMDNFEGLRNYWCFSLMNS